jgi:hypothetical protein
MTDRYNKTSQPTPTIDAPERERSPGHRVPRLCLLDGFAEGLNDSRGVNVTRLEALTQLQVTTADTVYRLTILEPFKSRILIEGGPLFGGGREVTLSGASLGRGFLKMRCIWIGLQMELHTGDCTVVTSPVSAIELLEDTFPTGSFAA